MDIMPPRGIEPRSTVYGRWTLWYETTVLSVKLGALVLVARERADNGLCYL